jgi:hypothetical protein
MSSARGQARLFLTRLNEVLDLDPLSDPYFLPIALDLSYRPMYGGSYEQKRAYGKIYGAMICGFMQEIQSSQFSASPVVLIVGLKDYVDYGFDDAGCDMTRSLLWIRHRPADGTPFYESMEKAVYEPICHGQIAPGPAGNRSRCIMEQYTSYGGFAVFDDSRPLDLNRFFGTETDLRKLAVKRETSP